MDQQLPKGKEPGWIVGNGGIRGEGKEARIMISTYNVGAGSQGGLYNTEKTSSDSAVSYSAHGPWLIIFLFHWMYDHDLWELMSS